LACQDGCRIIGAAPRESVLRQLPRRSPRPARLQPDASGAMSGGNYSLTGGFWSLISVVQTPGAPTLYISHSGNTVTVFWQNVSGWSLHQNNNLAVPTGWSVNSSWTTNCDTNYLNLASPTGNLFFRLSNP